MKNIALCLIVLLAFTVLSTPAVLAQEQECADHDSTTIESLYHCVQHAIEMGHITNQGVGKSLLAKIDAALAAEARGQTAVAVRQLRAFIREVRTQAGISIQPEHAAHMIDHALRVIDALS